MKLFHENNIITCFGQFKIFIYNNNIIRLLLPYDNRIAALRGLEKHHGKFELDSSETELTYRVKMQLDEYFLGKRKYFDLPVMLAGSNFLLSVLKEIQAIEYGKTISYIELANAIGCKSARAVGNAVGANPIPIILPCHRVINKNGKPGGYRGGLTMKLKLLKLEGIELAKN